MFYAFSQTLNKPVSISDVYDLNETFNCLNPECNAKFYIRSSDGQNLKHFCRKKSTPHIENCAYDKLSYNFKHSDIIIKSELYDIYNSPKATTNSSNKSSKGKSEPNTEKIYINTPKQLLQYCLFNDESTIYMNDKTINDIIVDCRTLLYNKYFEGFSGIKLVLGNTIQFNKDNSSITFVIKRNTKNGKIIYLTATVIMNKDVFNDVIDHILNTNKSKFSSHQIAVLGDWRITSKYNVECTLLKKRNIIYKF